MLAVNVPLPVTVPPLMWKRADRLREAAKVQHAAGNRVVSAGQVLQQRGRARPRLVHADVAAEQNVDRAALKLVGNRAGQRAGAGHRAAGDAERADRLA